MTRPRGKASLSGRFSLFGATSIVILLLPKQTEKCKIMKHLEVVFLAVIVVIYPFLFAVIYEMRHISRRSRDLPLFPAPSDSLS